MATIPSAGSPPASPGGPGRHHPQPTHDPHTKHEPLLTWAVVSPPVAAALCDLCVEADAPAVWTLLANNCASLAHPAQPYAPSPLPGALALILRDLWLHTWRLGLKLELRAEAMAALFAVVHRTHVDAVATWEDNMPAVLQDLRARLVRHSLRRPPFADPIFSLGQARVVQDYLLRTYFRHFRFYKTAFAPPPTLDLRCYPEAAPHDHGDAAEKEHAVAADDEAKQTAEATTAAAAAAAVTPAAALQPHEAASTLAVPPPPPSVDLSSAAAQRLQAKLEASLAAKLATLQFPKPAA